MDDNIKVVLNVNKMRPDVRAIIEDYGFLKEGPNTYVLPIDIGSLEAVMFYKRRFKELPVTISAGRI
jgi:hypothetical protein